MEHGVQNNGVEEAVCRVHDVWDWQTRVLHWVNALLVFTLIFLILGSDAMKAMGVEKALRAPLKKFHSYAGHVFAVTFLLRVAWGFLGNAYARWSDIIPLKREKWVSAGAGLRWYLNGFKPAVKPAIGHDPLASVFYTVLFFVFGGQVLSGLALSGIEFGAFPGNIFVLIIGQGVAKGLKHSIEEAHEIGMLIVIVFFILHIGGLVVHEVKGKNGLFSSMISGRKFFKSGR